MSALLLSVVLIVFLIVLTVVAFAKLRRRDDVAEVADESELAIDVAALPQKGPPAHGPQLEAYHLPVRLAVFVLAPAGRDAKLPDKESLPDVVEQLAPGLMKVLSSHQPLFRRWEGQLSASGFEHKYFRLVSLPGDRGKGSVWSSLVGRFEANGQQLLVGMTVCADKPNGLGEVVVENFGQWLDVLRVKDAPPSISDRNVEERA